MYTKEEALQYIEENDVKFIKLFFMGRYGAVQSLSIQPTELLRAFETGIRFDANAVRGFENVRTDLFIVPDPATLCVLPWRPQTGRVVRFFCNIRHADGTTFDGDARALLTRTVRRLAERGYECKIGTECEFYLFKLDEKGNPTKEPHDNAGYCDLAPRDRGENVRREICLTLEQMGVQPESSHHEKGAGQHEVDFRPSAPLSAADNLSTFKTVVKTVADRYGLFASFSPKPAYDAPSALYINVALCKDGKNLLAEAELSDEARSFIAGILYRAREMTLFLNPLDESYARLGWNGAPREVGWTRQPYNQLIRVPVPTAHRAHLTLRSPDPSCNHYLALALVLAAGLEGIEEKRALCEPKDADSPSWKDLDWGESENALPCNTSVMKELAAESDFIKSVLSPTALDVFTPRFDAEPTFAEI